MRKFVDNLIDKISKNSFVFFMIVITCVALIVILSLSIQTDDMFTVNVRIEGNVICIDEEIVVSNDHVFVYQDRNERVYALTIKSMYFEDGQTFFVVELEKATDILGLSTPKADIPISKSSVFERVFLKGGKNK